LGSKIFKNNLILAVSDLARLGKKKARVVQDLVNTHTGLRVAIFLLRVPVNPVGCSVVVLSIVLLYCIGCCPYFSFVFSGGENLALQALVLLVNLGDGLNEYRFQV
jgi:hypothetical protein